MTRNVDLHQYMPLSLPKNEQRGLPVVATATPAFTLQGDSERIWAAQAQKRTICSASVQESPRQEPKPDEEEDEEKEVDRNCCAKLVINEHGKPKDHFIMLVGCVIVVNTISMAVETDHQDWKCWWFINNCFLLFFVVEIVARISAYGREYFCPSTEEMKEMWGWNMFDFIIVSLSVLDLWIKDIILIALFPEAFVDEKHSSMAKTVMILRMFRILRILRVLRLFQSFQQLMTLMNGIFDSMQLVAWIALLMFMVIMIFSIVITNIVGMKAEEFPEEIQGDITEYWGGVLRSMVTLFQYLTLDDWSNISKQVYDTMPVFKWVFDIFVAVQAFAMLSLLTGVIAEHMSEVSDQVKETNEKTADANFNKKLQLIHEQEWGTSEDEERKVDINKFNEILSKEKKNLAESDVELDAKEIDDFWALVDRDTDNFLTWKELKDGLIRLRRKECESKDLLRLRCAAERVAKCITPDFGPQVTMDKLNQVNDCMNEAEKNLVNMQEQITGFLESVKKKNDGGAIYE